MRIFLQITFHISNIVLKKRLFENQQKSSLIHPDDQFFFEGQRV